MEGDIVPLVRVELEEGGGAVCLWDWSPATVFCLGREEVVG